MKAQKWQSTSCKGPGSRLLTLDVVSLAIRIWRYSRLYNQWFYLSMLRRRHFPKIGAHREYATLLYNLAWARGILWQHQYNSRVDDVSAARVSGLTGLQFVDKTIPGTPTLPETRLDFKIKNTLINISVHYVFFIKNAWFQHVNFHLSQFLKHGQGTLKGTKRVISSDLPL